MSITFLTNEDKTIIDQNIARLSEEIGKFYKTHVEQGKNLFDSSTFVNDKTLNYVGDEVDSTGYGLSDYIKVEAGRTLYFSYNSVLNAPTYLFTFDSQKNFIARLSGAEYTEYTVPDDVRFIRVTITNGRPPLYMIEYDELTTYEAYYRNVSTVLMADNIVEMQEAIEGFKGSTSKLHGKRLCVCGDSLTYGAYADTDAEGARKTHAYYVAKRCGMELVVNAVSGSSLTTFKDGETGGGASFTYGDEYARYKRLGDNLDYIIIWFGLNDNTYLAKTNGIGTIDSTDKTTFYGAWNTVLPYLIAKYPLAKIGIIVTYGASKEIRDATRAIAKKYGIPTLDPMGDESVPIFTGYGRDTGTDVDSATLTARKNAFVTSGDTVHLIDAGYQYFSTVFENYLMRL